MSHSPHHGFDVQLAIQFGIEEAVVIHHFQHWICINRKRGKAFRDGRTWTFQTLQHISDQMPYFTTRVLERIIASLIKKNIIMKGSFHPNKLNRVLWYAFVDESKFSINSYISPNGEMDHANGEMYKDKDPKEKDAKEQQQPAKVKPQRKKPEKVAEAPPPVVVFSQLKEFSSLPIAESQKQKLAKDFPDPDKLEKQAKVCNKLIARGKIETTPMQWMRAALKNDWEPSKTKEDIYEDNKAYAEQLASKPRVRGKPKIESWSDMVTVEWRNKAGNMNIEDVCYEEKDFKFKIDRAIERATRDGK